MIGKRMKPRHLLAVSAATAAADWLNIANAPWVLTIEVRVAEERRRFPADAVPTAGQMGTLCMYPQGLGGLAL